MNRTLAVMIDPDGDLVDRLGAIEWWAMHIAWPDGAAAEAALDRAADLLGDLAVTLQAAQSTAPRLYTPNANIELGPLAVVDADLPATSTAVRVARLAVPDDPLPDGSARVLRLVDGCAAWSRDRSAPVLVAAVLGAPIWTGRSAVRLDEHQLHMYRRFIDRVLIDPLDRWAATGSDPTPRYPAAPDHAEPGPYRRAPWTAGTPEVEQ